MEILPAGSRVFPTQAGSKEPRSGTHAHKDAVPMENFDFSLVPRFCNYGVALDGKFLLVDFDRPVAAGPFATVDGTWEQSTRRGWHKLYLYDGPGSNKKFAGGDVKVRGYFMGPGSVVDGTEYTYMGGEPIPAPQWLREYVESGGDPSPSAPAAEQDGIHTNHDDFLYATASWLRGRYALSQEAIERFLQDGPLAVLEGGDEADPYTETDIARLARSAARHEATEATVVTTILRPGTDVATIPPKVDWILPGFVPAGQLTILYGDGKIGKSSWASWLAAKETQRGNRVVFLASGEESFDLFVQRARLNGADDALLYEYQDPAFNLTTGVPRLQNALTDLGGVSLVYIDALYSQFGESSGENEAVRARRNLMGLATMCHATGIATLGTVHENAQGNLLGSREMRNVARSLLHGKGGKGKAFTIWSVGSNAWSPDYGVAFPGRSIPVLSESGEQLVFEDLYGEKIPQSVWVLDQGEKVVPYATEVVVDEVEESAEDKIRAALNLFPDLSNSSLAEMTGLAKSTVLKLAGAVRTQMGLEKNKGGRPPIE